MAPGRQASAAATAAAQQRPPAADSVVPPHKPTVSPKSASGSSSSTGDAAASKADWRQEVIASLAEAEGFAELTIRAKVATAQPWHTVTVRPVTIRGVRHLQVTTFTARQSTAANHPLAAVQGPRGGGGGGGEAGGSSGAVAVGAVVQPLLDAAGVGSVTLRTSRQDLAVQITKRGKGIVHRTTPQSRPSLVVSEPGRELAHDRPKDTPIPADSPHPFLQKIGFQTTDGRIRANMQDKFSQVNEFLKLLGHTTFIQQLLEDSRAAAGAAAAGGGGSEAPAALSSSILQQPQPPAHDSSRPRPPLHILDCGCGSSHLSFGTYHYLNHVLQLPATMGGVDVNAGLMARANENVRQLGLEGRVRFDAAPIGEFRPPLRPDIVLALHACDTATDDALALAVKQGAPLVMAVPCCQTHLHKQLAGRPPSSRPPWAPLLRHNILRQRQLDLLTDSLRAQLMRVAGYRTDVVEFVSTEHTPRNLLIRAVRQHQNPPPQPPQPGAPREPPPPPPPPPAARSSALTWRRQQLAEAQEYLALRDYWGVTPRLEVLLQEELGPLLAAAAAGMRTPSSST